jgi:hypothetical protein
MKLRLKINGKPYSTVEFHPDCSPKVLVYQSHDARVFLPSLLDNGLVGDLPSWQCPVCGALLKAPAAPAKPGGLPECHCPVCGSVLQAPAAPAKQSSMIDLTNPTQGALTAAINHAEALKLEVEQLKAQLFGVEVFDVDRNQTEQVVRTDVEPAPKRLKRLKEVRVKTKKVEVDEDLEETQENYQIQITFTDKLQTKLDEVAQLALANGAEPGEVNKIKRRA